MALYDLILHQNLAESDVEYQEVFPNLASGDATIYNVIVAGEDGVPRLPNKTIREYVIETIWTFHVETDTIILHAGDTYPENINLTDGWIEINAYNQNRIWIANQEHDYGYIKIGESENGYIMVDVSYNGDFRIDGLELLTTPNEKTLYIDYTDNKQVKYRPPEPGIPNYVRSPWKHIGPAGDDPDARAKIDELIAVVNGILVALRAHKVIWEDI